MRLMYSRRIASKASRRPHYRVTYKCHVSLAIVCRTAITQPANTAMSIYSPNAIVRDFPNHVAGIRQRTRYIPDTKILDFELSLVDVAVLELFAFYADPEEVFHQYSLLDFDNDIDSLYESMCNTKPLLRRAEAVHIHIGKTSVQCEGFIFNNHGSMDYLGRVELTNYSAKDPRVAVAILLTKREGLTLQSDSIGNFDDFTGRVKKLQAGGFLLPDIGAINWGDLRRPQPLCQFFGFMRGTPIDRITWIGLSKASKQKFVEQLLKSEEKKVIRKYTVSNTPPNTGFSTSPDGQTTSWGMPRIRKRSLMAASIQLSFSMCLSIAPIRKQSSIIFTIG